MRLQLPVQIVFTRSLAEMIDGYFPWYVTEDAEEVDFGDDARPVALREFPAIEAALRPARTKKIAYLRESFRRSGNVQLLIPAYDLGEGRRLFLDGCHRLAALAGEQVELAAAIFTLIGPLEPSLLPDLVHWQRRVMR
ncbi:MAG: hypothetical protein M3271_10515 [Actinomycetota bacterium]|nr:hypothetical protein [Actinomycetota bacterium]